jgi:hypothetical protein
MAGPAAPGFGGGAAPPAGGRASPAFGVAAGAVPLVGVRASPGLAAGVGATSIGCEATLATYASIAGSGGVRQPLTSRLTQTINIKHFDIARSPYPETASNWAARSLLAPLPDWLEPGPRRRSPEISAASDYSLLTHAVPVVDRSERGGLWPRAPRGSIRSSDRPKGRDPPSQPASSRLESATAGSCQRLRYAASTSSAIAD